MAVSILVIDDSASLRQVVAMTLKAAGYDVLQAGDGREAIEVVARCSPDVVLMDLVMPQMDGVQTITALRPLLPKTRFLVPNMNGIEFVIAAKKLPAYKFMPILMLTTETQESKKAECKAAGAKAWMVKPFSPSSLLSAVSKFCIP